MDVEALAGGGIPLARHQRHGLAAQQQAQVLQQGELGGARGDGWLQLGEGAATIPQASQQGPNPVAIALDLPQARESGNCFRQPGRLDPAD